MPASVLLCLFLVLLFICEVLPITCWCVLYVWQLDISKAAQKAVGELDTVLGWLEGLE